MVVMGLRMSKVARTDSRFPLAHALGNPLLMIMKPCETKSLPGVNRRNNSSGTVCLNILRREMRQQAKELWGGVCCGAAEGLRTALLLYSQPRQCAEPWVPRSGFTGARGSGAVRPRRHYPRPT